MIVNIHLLHRSDESCEVINDSMEDVHGGPDTNNPNVPSSDSDQDNLETQLDPMDGYQNLTAEPTPNQAAESQSQTNNPVASSSRTQPGLESASLISGLRHPIALFDLGYRLRTREGAIYPNRTPIDGLGWDDDYVMVTPPRPTVPIEEKAKKRKRDSTRGAMQEVQNTLADVFRTTRKRRFLDELAEAEDDSRAAKRTKLSPDASRFVASLAESYPAPILNAASSTPHSPSGAREAGPSPSALKLASGSSTLQALSSTLSLESKSKKNVSFSNEYEVLLPSVEGYSTWKDSTSPPNWSYMAEAAHIDAIIADQDEEASLTAAVLLDGVELPGLRRGFHVALTRVLNDRSVSLTVARAELAPQVRAERREDQRLREAHMARRRSALQKAGKWTSKPMDQQSVLGRLHAPKRWSGGLVARFLWEQQMNEVKESQEEEGLATPKARSGMWWDDMTDSPEDWESIDEQEPDFDDFLFGRLVDAPDTGLLPAFDFEL
jgi:hypothetical protein